MNNDLIKAAIRAYMTGGVSIIPINAKTKGPAAWLLPQAVNEAGEPLFYELLPSGAYIETTKNTGRPKGTWEPYQQRQATSDEIELWLRSGVQSLAMVCGEVSGNAEILDFDNRNGETFYDAWRDLAGDPVKQYGLPLQQTGGMGYQLAWRCETIESNQKLAWVLAPEEECGRKTMIETRGQHGYALLPPSLHPSGRKYKLLAGRFSSIPIISKDVRSMLLDCAKQLSRGANDKVKVQQPRDCGQTPTANNEVVDAYNQRFGLVETLRHYNYTFVGGNRWSRPGKEDSGGVVVYTNGKAYGYSSNDKMDGDRHGIGKHQPFTQFDLYAIYEHDGDYKAAVKAAATLLGIAYKLHTLVFVEEYSNAAAIRDEMFKQGWNARGFHGNSINAQGVEEKGYETIIVWSYDSVKATQVASMLPGAYPLTVPNGLDAVAMAKAGILRQYLEAVLIDAKKSETMTCTPRTSNQALT